MWKPKPQTREEMADASDARVAWQEPPGEERIRWWCKDCRDEGKVWLTPEPCIHVRQAVKGSEIPFPVAQETVRLFAQADEDAR